MRRYVRRSVLCFVFALLLCISPAMATPFHTGSASPLPPAPFSKLPIPISALARASATNFPSLFSSPPRVVTLNRSTDFAVDPNQPMVALTFDDGPSEITPRILETLERYGGRATFFVIGRRVDSYKNTLRQAVAQGCEIANHTYTHVNLTKTMPEDIYRELNDTNAAVEAITGIRPTFLRAPYGSIDDVVQGVAKDIGMPIVKWSVDTLDWKTRDAQSTYDEIVDKVRDGSIILCHDLYTATADAMDYVIPELTARGYQLVTVSELLQYKVGTVHAGNEYK